MSEPRVPSDVAPEDVDAPVVRDEQTGEQRYPEEHGGSDRVAPDPAEGDPPS